MNLYYQLQVAPSNNICCNINIILNSEIQILDVHKKKTIQYGLSPFIKKTKNRWVNLLTVNNRALLSFKGSLKALPEFL